MGLSCRQTRPDPGSRQQPFHRLGHRSNHAPGRCRTRLTYQNDKLKPRAEKMAEELGSSITLPCDVESDAEIAAVFETLQQHWDGLDIVVHSLAPRRAKRWKAIFWRDQPRKLPYRPRHQLLQPGGAGQGRPAVDAGTEWRIDRHDPSGWSAGGAQLQRHGAWPRPVWTPTSAIWRKRWDRKGFGSMPFPPGPIRTLAASGIKISARCWIPSSTLRPCANASPSRKSAMRRLFYVPIWPRASTGEIVYVDGGFNTVARVGSFE